MDIPIRKNDDIVLEICGMSSEGAGVGRYEGCAVFVPFALPGETVSVHIIKVARSYAVGKLNGVISCSPERCEPLCSVFAKCGGCALQHMSYSAQLEFKRNKVAEALKRLGGIDGVEVRPTIGMDDPSRCRNKGSFPFDGKEGEVKWGLFAPRSHRLIPVNDCIIENEASIKAAEAAAEWANANSVPAYDENAHTGILRHVVTRSCSGGTSVCIVTTGKLPKKEDLIKRLNAAVPHLASVFHNVNRADTNVITGAESRVIWGAETVTQRICGLDFSVSSESFLQVNSLQTERLYSLAIEGLELNGTESVADVFCGIGTISLLLAKHAGHVLGIECVPKAIENARSNALINGINNAEFICGNAEEVLPRCVAEGRKFDCITLDPPRKGAEPAVIEAIAASGAGKIAYISCDPATLARDLKLFNEKDYRIISVQPVDMFPMTAHVETVVLMTRN